MSLPTLQIVVASTRPGRIGLPVARWAEERAVEHGAFEVEFVDLAEVGLPFLDEPKHPRLGDYVHQHTRDWSATVSRADAFVFVTPEYNHGFNAVLKNALDFLHAEWQHKPAGFVSYGGIAGGTRAVQMLKPVLAALKMVPLFEAVHVPFVQQLIGEDGRFEGTDAMREAAVTMYARLALMAELLAPARGVTAAR